MPELIFSFLISAIFFIVRWLVFLAASIVMVPAWFLTIAIHPYWIKIFDPKTEFKKMKRFNLEAVFILFKFLVYFITGIIIVPAWLIAFLLNDAWLSLIGE